MKYFLCLIVTVVILGCVQVDSSSATWRIDSEFKTDQNRMKVQLLTEGAKVKNRVKTRTDSYLNEYEGLMSLIGTRLNQRGSDGELISEKLQKSFTATSEDLKTSFAEQMKKPEFKDMADSLKKESIDSCKQDVAVIKNAVEDNRSALKCWDSYRQDSRMLFDDAIATILNIVDVESKKIDDAIETLKAEFTESLDKVDADNTCGSDGGCIIKYFSDNSERIFKELNAYSDKSEATARQSMDEIIAEMKTLIDDFKTKFEAIRQTIQPCVTAA